MRGVSCPVHSRVGGKTLLEKRALEPQQPLLAVEPSAVAGEVSARADDAVAGENDRDRVPVHDGADSPCRLGRADACGKSAVRRRRAVGHLRELDEDVPIEVRRSAQVELEVERVATAGEVLVQLELGALDGLRTAENARAEAAREVVELLLWIRVEVDAAEAAL